MLVTLALENWGLAWESISESVALNEHRSSPREVVYDVG